jgi:predicted metalloprotease
MDRIFGWPGVYWTARILLAIVMGGGSLIVLVLLIRFMRPSHVLKVLKSDPPQLDEVGGEFAGAKASVKFAGQSSAVDALGQRVTTLEARVEELWNLSAGTAVTVERLMKESRG